MTRAERIARAWQAIDEFIAAGKTALDRWCRTCDAPPGKPCHSTSVEAEGKLLPNPHVARTVLFTRDSWRVLDRGDYDAAYLAAGGVIYTPFALIESL